MQRTVLIVDDELVNREILANMLNRHYEVLKACSGAEGLELMRQNYKTLSAVLLDVKMPGMDGYELLLKIQENALLNPIPVVVVTALTDAEAEEKARSFGACGFVRTPFRSADILKQLKDAVAEREGR